eukprot:4615884-Alexandrium_andersonii.AAC.1
MRLQNKPYVPNETLVVAFALLTQPSVAWASPISFSYVFTAGLVQCVALLFAKDACQAFCVC